MDKFRPDSGSCYASPDNNHCCHATGEYYAIHPRKWFMYCCWCGEVWHEVHKDMPVNTKELHGNYYSKDGREVYNLLEKAGKLK